MSKDSKLVGAQSSLSSSSGWDIGGAIYLLRKELDISQKDFSKALGVSAAHISGIESGNKQPSVQLAQLILEKFEVRQEWFDSGAGEMFLPGRGKPKPFLKKYFPTPESRAVLGAIFLAPFMPVAAAGLALGAGASEIASRLQKYRSSTDSSVVRGSNTGASEVVSRMCKYSGTNTYEELAKKLGVRVATISDWKKKNKIPDKYIEKVAKDAGIPAEVISHPVRDFDELGHIALDVVWEILEKDRQERISKDRLSEILTLGVIAKLKPLTDEVPESQV